MTTTADEIAAVEAALLSDYLALYFDKREELDAGRTAFAAIVSRLRELEARIETLEALIDECCSLRDVMNYPDGEKLLNEVRANARKPPPC